MADLWSKLKDFNRDFNDLPRRILIVIGTCLMLFIFIWAFPYLSPFVFAFIVAAVIEPVIRLISRLFHDKKPARIIASIVFVLLIYGLILALAIVGINRIIIEIEHLIPRAGQWVSDLSGIVSGWMTKLKALDIEKLNLPISEELLESLISQAQDELGKLGGSIAGLAVNNIVPVATFAVGKALSLPEIVFYIVLMVMGTYYFSADRKQIFAAVRACFPKKVESTADLMKTGFLTSIMSQIKAALIMMVVIWIECAIGFSVLGLSAPIFLALIIGVADALPIIGAGLFLIPMSLYGFIFSDLKLGVGALVIYLIVTVSRQVLQPKVLSQEMGLHPLLTMMTMYAGFKVIGVAGMLIGPIIALLCKAMFVGGAEKAQPEPEPAAAPQPKPRRTSRNPKKKK